MVAVAGLWGVVVGVLGPAGELGSEASEGLGWKFGVPLVWGIVVVLIWELAEWAWVTVEGVFGSAAAEAPGLVVSVWGSAEGPASAADH